MNRAVGDGSVTMPNARAGGAIQRGASLTIPESTDRANAISGTGHVRPLVMGVSANGTSIVSSGRKRTDRSPKGWRYAMFATTLRVVGLTICLPGRTETICATPARRTGWTCQDYSGEASGRIAREATNSQTRQPISIQTGRGSAAFARSGALKNGSVSIASNPRSGIYA